MDQNLNIEIKTENGNEIILRTGKALDPVPPKKYYVIGAIESVVEFVRKRDGEKNGTGLQYLDRSKAIIEVESNNICLKLDPTDEYGTVIVGDLKLSDELKRFAINENKQYSREELIKLIRFNRLCFTDLVQYEKVLSSYQRLSISTAARLNQDSDTRGNQSLNFQKTVDSSNIPTEFILNIPIFKGFPTETFRVEICLDATDASVRFWLESAELHELIETRRKKIFNDQLSQLTDFVCIHK